MSEIDLGHLDLNLLVTFDVLMAEGSVTRAAARLGRTQSAVSHSLARLREQVGDPLMVKVGGGMAASPFAEKLIEEVRPILRTLQRVVAPPRAFDARKSDRVFRVAVSDFTPSVMPEATARIRRDAPNVTVEWLTPGAQTIPAIAEGQIDVALTATVASLPEGVVSENAATLPVLTFARKGHPAVGSWGAAAWAAWPHVQVVLGVGRKTGMERAVEKKKLQRFVGARVPNFGCVPDLLARTDMIATLPLFMTDDALERFGLCALAPPFEVEPVRLSLFWNFRATNDPASRWMRAIVKATFDESLRLHAQQSARRSLMRPRAGRR